MFWNKIPKGYVETVDGYIVRKSECKKLKVVCNGNFSHDEWHKNEQSPIYDILDVYQGRQYQCYVEVGTDGTPIGYHTEEEVEELKKEIKELKDKYEPDPLADLKQTQKVQVDQKEVRIRNNDSTHT